MSRKPIVPRECARRDVAEAVEDLAGEAGEQVALGFISSVERAYHAISEHPGAGSPRYAHELNLPGLRSRLLKRYPYVVFYIERADHIEVWRVLHAHRNIQAWLQQDENA